MEAEAIQELITANTVVRFETGTYDDLSLEINGSKTFIPQGTVILNGGGKDRGISVSGDAAVLTIEGGSDTSFTVTGYRDGIFVGADRDLTINITENSALHLNGNIANEINHGNGIWADRGTNLTIHGFAGAVFTSSDNQWAGINLMMNSTANLIFEGCELVELSRNEKCSGYHAGSESPVSTAITFNNCKRVSIDENGWDAINFQTGDYSDLNIIDCGNATMSHNKGWGTNAGTIYIENSNLDISDNAEYPNQMSSCSNMYCASLTVINSKYLRTERERPWESGSRARPGYRPPR